MTSSKVHRRWCVQRLHDLDEVIALLDEFIGLDDERLNDNLTLRTILIRYMAAVVADEYRRIYQTAPQTTSTY